MSSGQSLNSSFLILQGVSKHLEQDQFLQNNPELKVISLENFVYELFSGFNNCLLCLNCFFCTLCTFLKAKLFYN